MKVTIQDIANMAGVSKSTVSRYLNNGYVSKENKEKIKRAIEKTGYQTNFFAKRLKSKKSYLIGVIIPRMDSYTATKTLKGIGERLQTLDYEMFISITNLDLKKELKYIRKFYLQGVDGIIVLASEIIDEHYKLVEELPIPILFVGQEDEKLKHISIDDIKVGQLMGEFIKEKGHKNIVYMGVSERDNAVGVNRKRGFMKAFEGDNYRINFVKTDFSFENSYKKAKEAILYDPSAIVCATDNIAIGVLRYLQENNIQVPEFISIAGFGGYNVGAAVYPPLTTVYIDYYKLGKKAAESIMDLIDGKDIENKPDIELKLIERQSVSNL